MGIFTEPDPREKILKIEEATWAEGDSKYSSMEGYLITTDQQEIKIGISNGQSCCENAGYLTTNDNIQDFVGAEILGIKLTDTALNTQMIKDKFEYGFDAGDIVFVDINTNKGTLQLAVYNSHNGYYGHSIEIKSNQLTKESSL